MGCERLHSLPISEDCYNTYSVGVKDEHKSKQ